MSFRQEKEGKKVECERIKEIIPAYIKHTALEEEAKGVEEHLCICHSCRQFLNQFMDKPVASLKGEKSTILKKKIGLWEYIVLFTAIITLGFSLYFLHR